MTPERLTALLRNAGALGEDQVVDLEQAAAGTFTTELTRLFPRLSLRGGRAGSADPETTLPTSLVAKQRIPGRSDRLGECFENETRFYRELAPDLPVRTPRFYGGDPDEGVLLLEDLTGLVETDWLRGPGERHARLALAALARLHATWWKQVDALDWVPSFSDPALLAAFEEAYERGFVARRELFEEVAPGFSKLGERLLGRVAESHVALALEPTLLHGDAHAENIPLVELEGGEEEVALLDWAGPRLGNAGVDVGFFIAMSFPAERRSGLERSLVAGHAEVLTEMLRERGVQPRVDPWLGYRRGVLRRITRLVAIAPGWDPAGLSGLKMVAHRCARAALELDVAELVT